MKDVDENMLVVVLIPGIDAVWIGIDSAHHASGAKTHRLGRRDAQRRRDDTVKRSPRRSLSCEISRLAIVHLLPSSTGDARH